MRFGVAAFFAFLLAASALPAQPLSWGGNRHPLARREYDVGRAASATRLEHMILVLAPDAARQLDLEALLAAQQDPHSPLYHQWLTPETFGDLFGLPSGDIGRAVSWLGAQGFSVDELPAGGRAIVFSGSAGQVEAAFHTPIDRYRVGGRLHLANAAEPRMPEALAGVAAGVLSLHDFRRQALHIAPQYSAGPGYNYLSPSDFAAIYDATPLYAGGLTGAGQSIAIVARTNIPLSDVQTFRATFGLPANNPTVIVNGADPGIVSADELSEADLDVEWPGAVAPMAAVRLVVSASTSTTDGVDLSAQYIVSHNLAPVASVSFGSCEQYMGSAERAFYNNLWQQAAAQGITVLVASGDSGAAGCDSGPETTAAGGAAVNGLCSTPYSVCVGGTEFNEGASPGPYWSAGSAGNWESALGYIPETVWNESASNAGAGLWAGGGGASAYNAKPAWQAGPGVPPDGMRDVPDVSLSAASHDCYLMVQQGSLEGIAGTSAAAPAFAGLMALVNQQTGSRQGNVNASLYALAALQSAGGLSYFHDVTTGNNAVPGVSGYAATAGYDRASGLGSVDAAILVNHWTDAATSGAPGFALAISVASLSVAAGSNGAATARVTVTGGFNAVVILGASGLPAGASLAFAPQALAAPGAGSSTLTVTVPSNVAPGAYSLTLTATGGSVTRTVRLPLTVFTPAGCTLAASATSFTLNPGNSASTQLSCGSVTGGFQTALAIGAHGVPQGVTIMASPATLLPGSGQSKVTIVAAAGAAPGSFAFSLTVTGGGITLQLPVSVTINPLPAFTLGLSSATLGVFQGGTGKVTVATAHVGAFHSAIAFSVAGLPPGVTASFAPSSLAAPGDGTSTLTIQMGATASAGTFNLTLTGAGEGQTKSQTLQLTTQVPPAFKLAIAQNALTVSQGGITGGHVTISGLAGGFNSAVALSVAPAAGGSLPAGLNPSFTPAALPAPGSGSSVLSFAPSSPAAPGAYALVVTARGGSVTQSAALSLTITPAPSFALHLNAAAVNVLAGGSASVQITSTASYGFASTVSLSTGALPAGVAVTFSPSGLPANGGHATINVQTTGSAAPGAYTVIIKGTGGNLAASAAMALNIGRLTVNAASASLSIPRGGTGAVLVSARVAGSYTGSVTLSVAGLPRGVTAMFASAMLKLTAASSTATGTYSLRINATGGGVTQSVPLALTIR